MVYKKKSSVGFQASGSSDPRIVDMIEKKFNVDVWLEAGEKLGYLYNIRPTTVSTPDTFGGTENFKRLSGIHLYFVTEEGTTWRTTYLFRPYFYVSLSDKSLFEQIKASLAKKLEKLDVLLEYTDDRIDLSSPDHLSPQKHRNSKSGFIKLSFPTVEMLKLGREELQAITSKNREIRLKKIEASRFGDSKQFTHTDRQTSNTHTASGEVIEEADILYLIVEIYEFNVLYVPRVCIDCNIRCGCWYNVKRSSKGYVCDIKLERLTHRADAAPLGVLAWDIECSKEHLKFPTPEKDEIILISYMYNAQGYLIVNRGFIPYDISEFTFAPTQIFSGAGSFKIFNEKSERDMLKRFFQHIVRLRPHVLATYNGDNFDCRFVHRRSQLNALDMEQEIGIYQRGEDDYPGHIIFNADCYHWVERDSYLPNGSRTLKAVCKQKLCFDPVEIDPEDMVALAKSDPQKLAVYSVSDAVATYYLYEKYIHRFILALCYIIPMPPDEVLRQGSGTLCEHLLMAEAFAKKIVFPSKHEQELMKYWQDKKTQKMHFVFDDSYVGGKVESLKCGLYRDDLQEFFSLDPSAFQMLSDRLDSTFDFWLNQEKKKIPHLSLDDFENVEEVKTLIKQRLKMFYDNPEVLTLPRIYHLDVGAMYPNIILSHRLQPPSIVEESTCSRCFWRKDAANCQKRMKWMRKLEISPAEKGHILPIIRDLKGRIFNVGGGNSSSTHNTQSPEEVNAEDQFSDEEEDYQFDGSAERAADDEEHTKKGDSWKAGKTWMNLTKKQQYAEVVKAVKDFSLKAHKRTKILKEVEEESIVCQRENSFYVDTVRQFRDHRYVYKSNLKKAESEKKRLINEHADFNRIKEAEDRVLLNDSLQLAHKCILNSFYGYVKRNGSRWYSQEMGAIVTYTGAKIIDCARELLERVGIPIELDTDGIWCMLPSGFPEVFELKLKNPLESGKRAFDFEFPCVILNMDVADKWTNRMYLEARHSGDEMAFETIPKNEIFFELDGPWHAMFLPASEKADELLKKRYVVYNHKNEISELKGFEIKRRGEMKMIQKFQEEIFPQFMKGKTKEEAFAAVAEVGMRWKELVSSHADAVLDDDDLIQLILAKTVLSKPVKSQPNAKSMGITAAKRLAEFLNNTSYIEDSPVFTQFVVSLKPDGAERTSRAVPIQIFQADEKKKLSYLARWLKDRQPASDLRELLDWEYYQTRLDVQLLKLICIPSMKQGINNPIPAVPIPDWLKKQQASLDPRQRKITSFFRKNECLAELQDIEDLGNEDHKSKPETTEEGKDAKKIDIEYTKKRSHLIQEEETSDRLKKAQKHGISADISPFFSAKQGLSYEATSKAFAFANTKKMFLSDFSQWLLYQKLSWSNIRKELKNMQRNSFLLGNPHLPRSLKMREQLKFNRFKSDDFILLMTYKWHLLDFQINQTDSGLFHCQVALPECKRVLSITVNVKRRIYINQVAEWRQPSSGNVSVKILNALHLLPRDVAQHNLIELEMNESYFMDKRHTLSATFHRQVAGIYELEIPLEFDFLSRCGALLQVHTTDPNFALDTDGNFISSSLSSAVPKNNSSASLSYLEKFTPVYVYIFHGTANKDARDAEASRIFAGVFDENSSDGNILMFGSTTAQSHHLQVNPSEIWNELISHLNDELRADKENDAKASQNGEDEQDENEEKLKEKRRISTEEETLLKFRVFSKPIFYSVDAVNRVLQHLDGIISKYQLLNEEAKGRHLIYLYGSDITCKGGKAEYIFKDRNIPVLRADDVPLKYSRIPRRDFLIDCITLSAGLLIHHDRLLEERLALSRVSNIPLGLLLRCPKYECYRKAYEVSYAQLLRQHKAILWASTHGVCDLGHPSLVATAYCDFDLHGDHDSTSFCLPGIYRGFGVEMFFGETLIFNAVRLAHILNPEFISTEDWSRNQRMASMPTSEIDGVELLSSSTGLNETRLLSQEAGAEGGSIAKRLSHAIEAYAGFTHTSQFSSITFRILGQVLETLTRSIARLKGKVSVCVWDDLALISSHFSSWISDPLSLLYDPALYHKVVLHGEIYLNDLMRECTDKLGLLVVYASLRELVLSISEYSLVNGRRKLNDALKRLNASNSIFNCINFDERTEYVAMIQFDADRYVRYKSYESPSERVIRESLKGLECLPEAVDACVRKFTFTSVLVPVRELVMSMYEDLEDGSEEPRSLTAAVFQDLNTHMNKKMKQKWFYPASLFKSVLELIINPQQLIKRFSSSSDDSPLQFPTHFGSNFSSPSKQDWRLHLIKYIVWLMKLDPALEIESSEVWSEAFDEKRHALFELTNESEYKPENTQIGNELKSLILKDVKCSNCNLVYDLNLISGLEEIYEDGNIYRIWRCPYCYEEYLRDYVEGRLFQALEERYYAYHAQDLICQTCRNVRTFHRALNCSCGQPFVPRLEAKKWREFFELVGELSTKAGFLIVQESINQLSTFYG